MSEPNRAGIHGRTLISAANLLFIIGAALALPSSPVEATTAAGRTVGSFAVSPTGAATYTIPIWAPPGPNGMQPHIALVYNSHVGGGFGVASSSNACGIVGHHQLCLLPQQSASSGSFGVGWSLQGLSSIYRCNLTYAQDVAPAAVRLATSDGYCMDGQRLRLTSSNNYGLDGSTYQTEIANFVNVTAHGSAGNGPAYWTAQDRNGRTYTYGNGGSSQVLATGMSTALSWQLNEVSDPAGNTMAISYTSGTGTAVPLTISWTPSSHGSSSYNYTMTFAYQANAPQSSYYGYAAGTSVQNTNLLSSITIAYLGTTVKQYVLSYQASATTSRDELYRIEECSDSTGSNCLLPTTFAYQSGTRGVSTTGKTAVSASTSATVYSHYDLNGDGYPDLIYVNGSTWYVSFGSASGYGSPVSTGISSSTTILPGDLLGKGTDGVLANNGGTWYYYTWNGSSFTPTSTGFAYDSTAKQYVLADVDGDGLPDLIKLAPSTPGFSVYISRNTGNGTTVAFAAAVDGYDVNVSTSCNTGIEIASNSDQGGTYGVLRSFDFDGDGRQDIAMELVTNYPQGERCVPPYTTYFSASELTSNGTSFTSHVIATGSETYIPQITFLNWNSDACTDFMILSTLFIAGCNGSAPLTLSASGTVIGAMDWDGDGRTDLLVVNGSTIGVYVSTGNGLSTLISTSVPYSSSNTYFTIDPTGDGLDAIGYRTSTGAIGYFTHNGAGQPPDLLSSATDGYGNSSSPTYVSLVQNNYTENGYGTPSYPERVWIGPMYVVSTATFSDPSITGGTYHQNFWYYGGWTNIQGRGFEGFYATDTTDSRNTLQDYQYYERSFPATGMKFQDIVSNGTFYPTQTVNTLPSQSQQSMLPWLQSSTPYQQRYFPYFSNATTTIKEVGGSENGVLITTASTNYTFDNYGNATSIATTVTDNDPNSPYSGSSNAFTTTTTITPYVDDPSFQNAALSAWCLSLIETTEVQYGGGPQGSAAVTRTKSSTALPADLAACRHTSLITEPNSSQFKVTETLAYDAFGNVNSDTVAGINMTPRQTTANWGTTGQFPMSVTDPTNALTQFNYNFNYGLISSLTDPNNIPTSWQYGDGFVRLTQELRADGTYTNFTYSDCAPSCLIGSHGTQITHQMYAVGGAVITDGTDYKDSVDRPLVSNKRLLSGYDRNEIRYDSLGNVSQTAFPCTWSSLTTTCTYWTTSSYDVLNRLIESQRPVNASSGPAWCNPLTIPPAPGCQGTAYSYAGRTTTVTDPQSNARVTITDVNGWLRQTKDPMGYNVTLAYDSAGSKTKVTDSLGNTLWNGTYNYGLAPYLANATDMDMGAWSFTIDALGEMTAWTDANTRSFSATYDALSRPLTRTDPATPTDLGLFTQWTWGSSATNHNIGKLQSACTGPGTSCTSAGYSESETYDNHGRPYQRSITISGYPTFTYTAAYDGTTGLQSTLTYPTSTNSCQVVLQYGYTNGMLASVKDASNATNCTYTGTVFWQANTQNPAGQITQETLGNGIVTTRFYDAVTHWLATAQSGVGGGSGVKNLGFAYDDMGNVGQRQDNNRGLTENIYYDNDYRFSSSKLNGTQNLLVTYDGTGNITSRSDVAGGASWTYDPNHKHEVTQAGSSAYQYSYDANGNAITRQGSTISWSSYNYPMTINAGSGSTAETVAFSYGPDRQRWQQMYTGNSMQETTNYIGGLLEVVTNGSVTDYRHYINVPGEHIAVYSRKTSGTNPNTFSYLLSDHQGSVASITNSSGAEAVGESFDAFGNRRNPTSWSGAPSSSDLTTIAGITREGYTFQTALGLWMGMNHMNGRVEDSITGRMLSGDPFIPDPTNSQSYNSYSYVTNNPLTYMDPTGFCGTPDSPGYGDCQTITITAPFSPGPDPGLGGTGSHNGGGPGGAGGGGGGGAQQPEQPPTKPEKPPTTPDNSPPPCDEGPSTASGSATGGGYAGPGGEATTGVDNGHPFATGRVGFGLGGGLSYDPTGGMPIVPASPNAAGNIRSVTFKFGIGGGVPGISWLGLSFDLELGVAYDSNSGFAGVANFNPGIGPTADKGAHADASIGGQVTAYDKAPTVYKGTGTCRAHN